MISNSAVYSTEGQRVQPEGEGELSDTNSKYPLSSHPGNQPDEYVSCPYFPEHSLRRSRLPYHLIKCQKNPKAPNLLACPYNYLHRVAPDKTQEHLLLCEDKVESKFIDKKIPSYADTRRRVFNVRDGKERYPPIREK